MKRRNPNTALLFPELSTGPENPWITAEAERKDDGKINGLTTLELCAGGGGQAIGLEQAGIEHSGLIELDKNACATLRLNHPEWNVIEHDLNTFDGSSFKGVDVISGGLRCLPRQAASVRPQRAPG